MFSVLSYGMAVAVIMLSVTTSSAQTIYPTSNTLKEAVNNLDQGIRETETVVLSGPNNTYDEETPDGYRVTKGDLTIYQDKDNRGIISGSLGADGASPDEKVSLTLYGIGTAEINTATGTASNVDNYWTNLQNGQTQATDSALLATNADLSITGVVFANSNNVTADTIWGNGGAMRMNENTTADIQQSLFYNNKTQRYGGAIDVDNETAIITNLQDNAFINNSAALHGGALDVDGAIQSMSGNVFSGNTAGSGGAMYVDGGSVTGTGNTFMNNTATENGGALYNALGTVALTDATFTGNSAQEGGAIFNMGEGITLEDSSVSYNTSEQAGAIYNIGSMKLVGTTISGNTTGGEGAGIYNATGSVTISGGGIFDNKSLGYGGGIYNASSGMASTITVEDTKIIGNSAARGGGIYHGGSELVLNGTVDFENNVTNTSPGVGKGGGIYVDSGTVTSNGTVGFKDNTASSGAGIYIQYGNVVLDGTVNLEGNTATENGGALYNALGTATLTDTTFTGNSAQEGGAVYNTGKTSFEGTTQVTGNSATDGAGIYNATGGNLTLSGTVNLENNTATGNGGALYNAGNLYVTGDNITIANNSADLGTSLYNAASGRAIFSNVNDEVDLDNESGTTGHTIFDQAGTIYNAGILDFINSTIQLHNGINTDAVLSDLSSRRVGTVNMQGSSIDLGGVDTEGTGILYADTLNISNNSTLRSHIGMLTDPNPDNNKYGSVSANTVSITGNNTLSLILPFWAKLGTDETRDYQILDANTINGEFSTLNNNLYDVYALGDGTYRITTKTNCQANATYDLATDSCVCNTGYVEVGGVCELKTTCGANEVYDEKTNTCSCASGYVEVNGVCELKTTCGANEVYDEETNSCQCASGYVEVNGVCELKTTCGANEVYDDATNTCKCASGYVEVNGMCELKTTCGANEVYDEETNTCKCASGYVEVNGVCELKTTCGANEVYDDATNTCKCASGYVEVNGMCELKTTCGANEVYDEETNTCKCASGYVEVNGVCELKTTCGANEVYDDATNTCKCASGYVEVNGVCELKTTCGANEVYDDATNTCKCASGYVEVGGVCELKVTCGANEVYDEATNTCKCASGYVEVNGVCELKTTCGANEVYDEETNTCKCASGYVEVNGVCELKTTCGANEVYDEETNTCKCASGYVEVNGVCVLQTTCGANEVYDEETNSCQCASGYVEVNGSCEAQITCGENANYDSATNTCRCRSGYEMVGDACLAACTGGKIRVGTECKCPNGQVDVNGVCQTKTDTTDYCPGCDENEKATANGWLQGTEMVGNELAQKIQNDLFEKFQEEGASMSYREALDGLAPDVTPLIEAHATEITRRLSAIVSERFYNSNAYTGYQHNGYRFYNFPRKQSNLWAQGLYGKSKYDNRKGFDMDSHGIAMGFDGHVSEALKLGAAYAYTQFDGDSVGRDTEIDSHSAMVYATYNPNKFYANWMGMYTRSTFDEEKKVLSHIVDADYDVDVLATQLMLGYKIDPIVVGNWASGVFKPEIGARYIWTRQHAYTDTAGQHVSSADGSTLTGILGTQYSVTYRLTPSVSWYPAFRAAVTYDFVQPDTEMSVGLVNGSSYRVTTEKNTERVGIELGAKIGLNVGEKTEVGLEYEGLFKGDYTNHTGMANLKYKF